MTENRRGQIAVSYITALLKVGGLPHLSAGALASQVAVQDAEQLGIDPDEYMEFIRSFHGNSVSGTA